jgi:hypothetical protein
MVASVTALVWTPPSGEAIEFRSGRAAPYRLISLDGIGPMSVGPIVRKSPGQIGETAVDVMVPSRVVVVQTLLQAIDRHELWNVRAALSRALVSEPAYGSDVTTYPLGRLRMTERVDQPDLELLCIPRSSSLPAPRASVGLVSADIEFFAPQPWWQSLYDEQLNFGSGAAGLEFPIEFDIEFLSNNVEQEAVNEGDVRAPVTWRVYGEVTTPKLTNVTTGEAIEVTGDVESDEYLEITTEFGGKRVEIVNTTTGARTNAMNRLNLSIADFWQLLPGANVVRFEAAVNTSGHALLLWRSRYSGI